MCKILIIPKIVETSLAKKFLRASVYDFTQNDNDGIGYAALNRNGTLTGERWRYPKDAFKPAFESCNEVEGKALLEISPSLDEFSLEPAYNSFGVDSDDWASVIYHARYATCAKNLANVHPFVNITETTALIHNGVISKHPKEWEPKASSCDSETLLNGYIDSECADDVKNFDVVNEYVQGYFALGVLAKQSSGAWILDVIKDGRAELQAVYVHELQSVVYCTEGSIVKKTCELLGWQSGAIYDVKDNVIIRYDALTSQILAQHEIEFYIESDAKTVKDAKAFRDAEAMGGLAEYEAELDGRYSRAMAKDDFSFANARDYSGLDWDDLDDDDDLEDDWDDDAQRVNKYVMRSDAPLSYDDVRRYKPKLKRLGRGRR